MSDTERIIVDGLGRLPQFSHVGRAGDLLFVSGTLGTTEGVALATGMAAQTTQALQNMGTILAAAGGTWDDVVKVTVFITDMALAPEMNEAYGAFFGDRTPPARITVGNNTFAFDALVEMECIAQRPTPIPAAPHGLPTRRQVTVDHDGEQLFVEVAGEEHRDARPPLVLSHGLGGNHAIWFQQIAEFATDRMVVAWDHRGFGRSTDRDDRSGPDVAAGDLLAVCDALDIATADLVGQSMGGWSVVGAALERPSIVRKLVFADTLGGFTSAAVAEAMAEGRAEPSAGDFVTVGLHPAIDPSLAARDPGKAHLYQLIGGFGSIDTGTLIGRLLATSHDEAEAARITQPVLCLCGDRDPLFPPAAVRAVASMLPDARICEVPSAGHSPYFEDPTTWNAVVRRFLDAD